MSATGLRPERTDIAEEVGSILYVGNSYLSFNNGIGWHVSGLHVSESSDRRLRATSVSITGGGPDWHDVDAYFRPDALGSYSFDEANHVVFNDLEKLFDVVLMMDWAPRPRTSCSR